MVDLVVLIVFFNLVPPLYFLKWNCYLLACKQKFAKFFMSFQKSQVSSPSNFALIFSVIKYNSSILFFGLNIIYFGQSNPLKSNVLSLLSARVKICQIRHVNFELTSQFLFNFCILFHCHDTQLACKNWAHTFPTLDKRMSSRSQFWDF